MSRSLTFKVIDWDPVTSSSKRLNVKVISQVVDLHGRSVKDVDVRGLSITSRDGVVDLNVKVIRTFKVIDWDPMTSISKCLNVKVIAEGQGAGGVSQYGNDRYACSQSPEIDAFSIHARRL